MNISFIPIDHNNLNDCMLLAKWHNDPEIKHLINPNFHEGEPILLKADFFMNKENNNPYLEQYNFFITVDDTFIGDINIVGNPDFLVKQDGNSVWLGITIGDKEFRGKGIGTVAMNYIEDFSRELGFKRIELGVFEFNKRAIHLYKSLGYKHFATHKNFTYHDGRWYDDKRYEKYL
ncbi:GNAT family N-acetyltransferase [Haloplasma contractile]|uniref:Phospholipiddiacylglycerol acyltransferase protein n=1 Tax=Haloplasma contractile SSD-17B TaxID=1033810 RepID=U2EBF1_9MOLU|nr:GNAT family protein [Haloplasma contractile]ERJ12413.1 phospholipiddiacylglycerol acyltransferase protein [Haloplasma contractile SSD-17B]